MPAHETNILIPAGSGDLWWIDSRVNVTLTAEQTDGHLGMWLWDARRGAQSPLHLHRREEEEFVVLDGELQFLVGEERYAARSGDTVVLPRDVPHAYAVVSETARVLGFVTPGGFEGFFTEVGTPVGAGEPEGEAPTIAAMAAAAPHFGVEILGPPPSFD